QSALERRPIQQPVDLIENVPSALAPLCQGRIQQAKLTNLSLRHRPNLHVACAQRITFSLPCKGLQYEDCEGARPGRAHLGSAAGRRGDRMTRRLIPPPPLAREVEAASPPRAGASPQAQSLRRGPLPDPPPQAGEGVGSRRAFLVLLGGAAAS